MSSFTLQTQVSDIVTAVPQTADLFRALRIDFCCGGKVPLEEAAYKRKLDAAVILEEIKTLETKMADYRESRPGELTEPELIEYIQHKHHAFLREELPALTPYVTKLARVHGEHHPELLRVQAIFADLSKELLEHTEDEDLNVFPLILKFVTNPSLQAAEELKPLVSELEQEHEQAGGLLKELREITSGFAPPVDACGTYRLVYQRLAMLEKDTFEHIHLENNVLFERMRAAE
ncbi:iron-sulfur cluster repair di-iron protein [Paenibacillus dokdonensis]|uniref:Iron-sulfur cluster repair di-iron protein n=1 Tax=Paenibacillus dokdonensis TaxID=2567944 RepID=A0ABU6GHI9_9BACL|nr:iron-sulfur cluster repair di-iron protein [Paenibacillus dokdonensis]MEC0239192.1 iron-sulfur cluster repair di-iron protein [Paenibacillus dokdonensis]